MAGGSHGGDRGAAPGVGGLGLSKHDQVIVTQPTIIKRNQPIPTCVACNRPLPVKKSKAEIARRKTLDATNPGADGKGAKSPKALLGLKPKKAKSAQREEVEELGLGPKFIYRGGFKMPRKPGQTDHSDGSQSLPSLRPATVPAGDGAGASAASKGANSASNDSASLASSNHIWIDAPKPEDPLDDWVESWN